MFVPILALPMTTVQQPPTATSCMGANECTVIQRIGGLHRGRIGVCKGALPGQGPRHRWGRKRQGLVTVGRL